MKNIKSLKPWLALDIDETLAWTIGYRVKETQRMFGNPEKLSAKAICKKYRFAQDIPYRQSEEIQQRWHHWIHSDTVQDDLPVIPWALTYVKKILKIFPITAYITIRPSCVIPWTRRRLKKHGFPDLPIIHKPDNITKAKANLWKARLLKKLYPTIVWIVDDNVSIVDNLGSTYKGTVFLFTHTSVPATYKNVMPCGTRKDVYTAVKCIYGKKS